MTFVILIFEALIQYIKLNNLKFNTEKVLSIFLYSLENKVSLDIIKYLKLNME